MPSMTPAPGAAIPGATMRVILPRSSRTSFGGVAGAPVPSITCTFLISNAGAAGGVKEIGQPSRRSAPSGERRRNPSSEM